MNEIPPLPTAQLKLVVTDPEELAKGLSIADRGGLKHLARHGNKLFAEAEGSGSAPYKVQIVHDPEKGYRGRCSCMAARSRPFCKHASALLVLWARDTNAFAVAEITPEAAAEPGAPARRAKTKTGKVDASALDTAWLEQGGILATANLRGLKEAGRTFAVPTGSAVSQIEIRHLEIPGIPAAALGLQQERQRSVLVGLDSGDWVHDDAEAAYCCHRFGSSLSFDMLRCLVQHTASLLYIQWIKRNTCATRLNKASCRVGVGIQSRVFSP